LVELPSQPHNGADGDAVDVYQYGGHHLAYQAYRHRIVAGSNPALPTTTPTSEESGKNAETDADKPAY
jgi:hypothetical protein